MDDSKPLLSVEGLSVEFGNSRVVTIFRSRCDRADRRRRR